jgi:regulation of enolase protein 1 (concanavalin A-like superfamily)
MLAALVVCVAASAHAQSASSVSSPWVSVDVGSPALAGSATQNQNTFQIDAAGRDIWDTADQFHFVYQQMTGDVDVRARVDRVTATDQWSKAGVMIRASLSAGSAHAFALVSAQRGTAFQRRRQSGALSVNTAGSASAAPYWVRLVRAGTRVTAFRSADGSTWTQIGSDTIALGSTAYVGIAVTSHNASAYTSASVSQVSVGSGALPATQAHADIGNPAVKGSVAVQNGVYTIKGAGRDIWDTSDQFHYMYQAVSGDLTVVARVRSIQNIDSWSKAGVMIRGSLSANAAYALALASAGKGYAYQRRPSAGAYAEHTSGGSGVAPVWVKLVRTGSVVQAYRSADGSSWTSMGSDSIALPSTVYVGLAVTSHDPTRATTAVVDNLKITAGGSSGGGSGTSTVTAAITSPSNGATFSPTSSFKVVAKASTTSGKIKSVEFFRDNVSLGKQWTAPFDVRVSGLSSGTHTFYVIARDSNGRSGQSPNVTVTISGSTNKPPVVSLTAPANGASYTAPASIGLTASASDPEGKLARVEFYAGSTRLGTDSSAPFSMTWSSVPAGTYTLTAVAFDTAGVRGTSAGVTVTVGSASYSGPRSVSFTASADHSTVTNYRLDVFASGANPSTATPIATSNLGKPAPDGSGTITIDRQTFFQALSPGSYIATVSAISSGGTGRSSPVSFTR